MTIELRPVVDDDRASLRQWYAGTREQELALVPWSDEQKSAFVEMQFEAQLTSYAAHYPAATHEIILADAAPAGRLYLDRADDRLHILDITVAAELRNRGIGAEVLRRILAEADAAGKPVSIYVEDFNPSQRLFARLGFAPAKVDGFLVLLERPAAGADVGPPNGSIGKDQVTNELDN